MFVVCWYNIDLQVGVVVCGWVSESVSGFADFGLVFALGLLCEVFWCLDVLTLRGLWLFMRGVLVLWVYAFGCEIAW